MYKKSKKSEIPN